MSDNIRILKNENVTKITLTQVPDRPGIAAEIFGAVGDYGANIEFISAQSIGKGQSNVVFTIPECDVAKVVELLEPVKTKIGASKIKSESNIAIVSVIAQDMVSGTGMTGKIFTALAQIGVNIDMINSSLLSVSCVIDRKCLEDALNALNKAFSISD